MLFFIFSPVIKENVSLSLGWVDLTQVFLARLDEALHIKNRHHHTYNSIFTHSHKLIIGVLGDDRVKATRNHLCLTNSA